MDAHGFESFRLLVVDDAPSIRSMVRHMLNQLKITLIDEADDGVSAQKLIRKFHYDCIICDWEMPEVSGIDLLRQVRHFPETKEIPFIMCTAKGTREQIVAAIKAGVTDYLRKPIDQQLFSAKLVKALKETTEEPVIKLDS